MLCVFTYINARECIPTSNNMKYIYSLGLDGGNVRRSLLRTCRLLQGAYTLYFYGHTEYRGLRRLLYLTSPNQSFVQL